MPSTVNIPWTDIFQGASPGSLAPVASIAALKAIKVNSLVTGSSILVLGYYAAGDGGAQIVSYNSASSATDNGVTVYQPTAGSGRFIRSLSGPIDVRSAGAKADGTTDDTTAIQNSFSVSTRVILAPGTSIITTLQLPSNIILYGVGKGVSILKRKGSDTNNLTIFATGKSFITLRDFSINGNKSSQTVGAHNLYFTGCSSVDIDGVESYGAKAASGYGDGLCFIASGDQSANTQSRFTHSDFHDNDVDGFFAATSWYLNISENTFNGNTSSGLNFLNFVFPPVVGTQNYLMITNNRATGNATGINVQGGYVGGTIGAPFPGTSSPQSIYLNIIGNTVSNNSFYGMTFEGSGGLLQGNISVSNGSVSGGAGYLFFAEYSSFIGNYGDLNKNFGVDAGGASSVSISNNTFKMDEGTAINIGGNVATSCVGNKITLSGAAAMRGITLAGYEGDGVTPFPNIASSCYVADNVINANASSFGIWAFAQSAFLSKHEFKNNRVFGTSANGAYRFETIGYTQSGNFDGLSYTTDSSSIPYIATAANLVIPDAGDVFIVSGAGTINNIFTYDSNLFSDKISSVAVTNGGSGYSPGSPPIVTFTGGGGSGAAGTAQVDNQGNVVTVAITNAGSGYTSAPMIGFSSGVAAATAILGCDNITGRAVTIYLNASTVFGSGNITWGAAGPPTSTTGSVQLLGLFGVWKEVNRTAGNYYMGNVGIGTGSGYVNFGAVPSGTSGYGIRDNAGMMEVKNSGGGWNALTFGGGPGLVTTVSGLPSAATAGRLAYVTDATTTVILGLGLVVTGGGANFSPVYSDGTSWRQF